MVQEKHVEEYFACAKGVLHDVVIEGILQPSLAQLLLKECHARSEGRYTVW